MSNNSNNTIDWVQDSKSFDAVANLYDVFRPSYPPELITYILSASEISKDGRVLEIGSGTGIATILLAQRGYSIFCIEPGENLVAVARQRLRLFSQVEFAITTFETWQEPENTFDLVVSAQAFHWIPKEIGYSKVAKALRTNGHVALFWNMYPNPQGMIFKEFDQVYRKYAPDLFSKNKTTYENLVQQRKQDLIACGYFDQIEIKRFPWSARYTAPQYVGLLNTYSDHLRLSEENRTRLFEEIAKIIDRYGGYVEKPYIAVVYIARKPA
jgi:SAM-dependent methyltransferase